MLYFTWGCGVTFLGLAFIFTPIVYISFRAYPIVTKRGALSLFCFGGSMLFSSSFLFWNFILLKSPLLLFLIPSGGILVGIYAVVRFIQIWHKIRILDKTFRRH